MKEETKTQAVSSFPVLGLLGAVLVILKVLGKITLAWKWVLAPFWIPAVFGIGLIGFLLVTTVIAAVVMALLD